MDGAAWENAPPGTPLVRFDDGSGIVKSTGDAAEGDAAEVEEMVRFLANKAGTLEEEALVWVRVLRAQGLAFKAFVPDTEPRALNGDTFEMAADVLATIRELTSGPKGEEEPPTE